MSAMTVSVGVFIFSSAHNLLEELDPMKLPEPLPSHEKLTTGRAIPARVFSSSWHLLADSRQQLAHEFSSLFIRRHDVSERGLPNTLIIDKSCMLAVWRAELASRSVLCPPPDFRHAQSIIDGPSHASLGFLLAIGVTITLIVSLVILGAAKTQEQAFGIGSYLLAILACIMAALYFRQTE
jgi:hypothetical protein